MAAINTANSSDMTFHSPLVNGKFSVNWYGNSFEPPPYWGVRGTWWLDDFNLPRWGVAVDLTHAKARADLDDDARLGANFGHLEFTNGLNTLTLNGLYRMPLNKRFSLYGGVGAGAAIPHVEVKTKPFQGYTYEYQVTGPSVQGMLGASFNLGHGFSLFGEYKANFTWNHADDLVGGGWLKTNILTNQFAIGVSYTFGAPPAQY